MFVTVEGVRQGAVRSSMSATPPTGSGLLWLGVSGLKWHEGMGTLSTLTTLFTIMKR